MERRAAGFPVWLLAAALLAYLNALPAAFQFDDYRVIVDNPAVHGLSAWWQAMPGIRPLLKLSYALNWELSRDPFGFHAVNVLLHLANVALVWRLTAWFPLTSPPFPKGGQGGFNGVAKPAVAGIPPSPPLGKGGEVSRGSAPTLAAAALPLWKRGKEGDLPFARLIATLLFALHPIQTEVVTYVTGRSMSLMALFGLAALVLWLAGRRGLALPLFAAALAVKEVALVFPLLLLLLDPAVRTRPAWIAALVLGLAGLLGALGYAYVLTEAPPRGLLANLASETNALFWLAGQTLQLWALNIDPDLPVYAGFAGLPALQLLALLFLAALAWRGRRRFPPLAFGLAWAAVLLAPMYSLIPRLDLANERHLYLAGLGLYWIIGAALAALPLDAWRRGGVVAALTLAGLLLTAARNQDYRDEVSLWRATVARSPQKDRAWNNLGYACALAGRAEEARDAFQRALRLNPQHPRAAANLHTLEAGGFGPRPSP